MKVITLGLFFSLALTGMAQFSTVWGDTSLELDISVSIEASQLWRNDGKCGDKNKLADGKPGQCNPQGDGPRKGPCCSQYGFCGNSEKHCGCQKCINYSKNNGLLPKTFLGTYKQTKQTGLEDILRKIGVDWFKRQMALKITPKHTFSQSDEMIKIFSDYYYKKFTQEFKLGVPFQKTTPDGRNLQNTVNLQGNKLFIKREPESKGSIGTEETWEFKNDGSTLEVTVQITDDPKIKSVEIYKKET